MNQGKGDRANNIQHSITRSTELPFDPGPRPSAGQLWTIGYDLLIRRERKVLWIRPSDWRVPEDALTTQPAPDG
jgi:hypothetical protein